MAAALGALILAPTGIGAIATFEIAGVSLAAAVGNVALLAGSVGLSYAISAGAAKQPRTSMSGQASVRQPNPVRQGGYGRARVSGAYLFYESNPAPASPAWFSHDVVALISGRVGGFLNGEFYLGDDAVVLTGNDVNTLPNDRYRFPQVNIDWRVGLQVEVAYSLSGVSGIWGPDHRGDGIASLRLLCVQADTIQHQATYFPDGVPNPSAVLDLFPIWDPRDAAQNPDDPLTWIAYPAWDAAATYAIGARVILPSYISGAPAYDGATTYAKWARVAAGGVGYFSRADGNAGHAPGPANLAWWLPIGAVYYSRAAGNLNHRPDAAPDKWTAVGQNPVLQIIDYLLNGDYGLGLERATLIAPALTALKAKADLCDTLVADKTGALGPRYAASGKFNFDEDAADVLGSIAAAADIWFCEDGDGALALEVGVYAAPAVTFTAEHIIGIAVAYGVADEQVANELTISFCDPANKWKEDVAGDPWRNEDDIAARGRLRTQALALPWVQRHSQARRLAKRAAARLVAPNGTVTLSLYGLTGLGQRWVRLQYPRLADFADVVVEITRGRIDLQAQQVTFDWMLADPTMDAWDAATEEGQGPGEALPALDWLTDDANNIISDDDGTMLQNEAA